MGLEVYTKVSSIISVVQLKERGSIEDPPTTVTEIQLKDTEGHHHIVYLTEEQVYQLFQALERSHNTNDINMELLP